MEERALLAVVAGVNLSTGTSLTTYTLALATTAELTQAVGGAAQTATFLDQFVDQLNKIYESELAIRFQLHPNNNQLIFTNAATDGFTNGDNTRMIDENTPIINTTLNGAANNDAGYDLGHVLGLGNDGGLAGAGLKGSGASNLTEPAASPSMVSLVGHEIGHQLSASHNFNGVLATCRERSSPDSYEPGSGSSIMSYSGTCGNDNLPVFPGDDLYFHANSFDQIIRYTSTLGRGTQTPTNNTLPTVSAGPDRTIPASTPFTLAATASDPDVDDRLTFTWEQIDAGGVLYHVLQSAMFTVAGKPATLSNTLNQLDQTTVPYVAGDQILIKGTAYDGTPADRVYTYQAGDTLRNFIAGRFQDPISISTAFVDANQFIAASASLGPQGQILVEASKGGVSTMTVTLQSNPNDPTPGSGITNFGTFSTLVAGRADVGGKSVPLTNADDQVGPLFRSLAPTSEASRTFPRLVDILANTPANTNKNEHLPTQNRDLNFRVTARDNHLFNGRAVSGIVSDDVKLTVVNTGTPFQVTSHNAANQSLLGGSAQTVTWEVAGTTANGINTSKVDLWLSIDGGLTYSVMLASQTDNDGSHVISMPNLNVAKARFKVQADPAQNIFFDVNDADFQIAFNPAVPGVIVAESGGSTRVGEGAFVTAGIAATDSYTIALSQPPVNPVEVTVTTNGQVQVSVDGVNFASSQKVTFATGDAAAKAITVRAVNDGAFEGAHTGTIRHSVTMSADPNYNPQVFTSAAITAVNANIFDDESPPLIGLDYDMPGGQSPPNWTLPNDPFQTNFNNLAREGGVDTPVDITVTLTPNCCNPVGGGLTKLVASTIPRHSPDISLVGDYVSWDNSTIVAHAWSDLLPNAKYRVYVMSASTQTEVVNQKITITGSGVDNPAPFIQNGAGKSEQLMINAAAGSSSADLEQFASIVTSDATGKISVLIEPQNGTNVHLVGLAIQEFFDRVPGFTVTETNGKTEVNETGASDTFTVKLDVQPANNVVLTIASGNINEATVGPTSLTFTNANWDQPQTVTVTGVDDQARDGDKTSDITIAINAAQSDANYVAVGAQVVKVTTKDNGQSGPTGFTLTETGGKTEVNETGTTDTFTVVLTSQPTANVVFQVTSAVTTEATVLPATLTFTAQNWNVPQTVTVTGVQDNQVDGNKTVAVSVTVDAAKSAPQYAAVAPQNVTVTIVDSALTKPWQNPALRYDVTGDGKVVPLDVLRIINELNDPKYRDAVNKLPDQRPAGAPYLDVNGDGFLTTNDALQLINNINAGAPEGESTVFDESFIRDATSTSNGWEETLDSIAAETATNRLRWRPVKK